MELSEVATIIESLSGDGLRAFYIWLAYRVFGDLMGIGLTVVFMVGLYRLFKKMFEEY